MINSSTEFDGDNQYYDRKHESSDTRFQREDSFRTNDK